jgi:hypothetical protein
MLKGFVSILLSAIILFAEAGQVVYAHTCFKSNETSFSLYFPAHCKGEKAKKSCCGKQHKSQTEKCIKGKESCCGISTRYVQQSFPTNETEIKKCSVVKNILLPVVWFTAPSNIIDTCSGHRIISSTPSLGFHSSSRLCVYRC